MRRLAVLALSALSLAACVSDSSGGRSVSQYSLSSADPGVFKSSNAGQPIALESLRGMNERQVAQTFGRPVFTRDDGPSRLLRFRSDACDLDLFLYQTGGGWQVRHAEARDPQLRSLPVHRCAGSVAAQKRTA
ncbi:MAG: hypothetical protein AB7O88_04445 [Reyranellaceae bacterium]